MKYRETAFAALVLTGWAEGQAFSRQSAEDPLHVRIDKALEASRVLPPAPAAADGAFLRRLFLDLTGRIPGPREARLFLEDPAPDKGEKLLDRLLAHPEHFRHMARVFDVMLMERRPDKRVRTDEWRSALAGLFAANRPYNEVAHDVLAADGVDPAGRPQAKFWLDRDVAPDALTRDVGRIFFGMDLQCAQCHDHPSIGDYLQRDYYGLYAFVSRAFPFPPNSQKPVVAERAEGEVKYSSVFTKVAGMSRPRVPDGVELDEPRFPKGEEYQVKPNPKDANVRPVPKYSRRAQLARLVDEATSRAFRRNIANRLWAHMMGRGLVEPLDFHHSDNPPSHPELLETLADAFAAMKYDVRAFLRELALTRTYRRAVEMPVPPAAVAKEAADRLPALEAEAERLQAAAEKSVEAVRKATGDLAEPRNALLTAAEELAAAEAPIAEARKAADSTALARDAARKSMSTRQDFLKTVREAAQKASEAAARLSDDKELATAAATFRSRSERLEGEVEAAVKDMEAKTAVAKVKAEALAAVERASDGVRSRMSEADARMQSGLKDLLAAEERRTTAKGAAAHAARRAADAKALADTAAAAESLQALARLKTELAAAREAASRLPARDAKVTEARKARDVSLRAAEAARAELAAKEEAARLVDEAASKAEAVEQKASKDAELVSAAARVKAKRDRLKAEVAELRKAAALSEEACRKAAEALAAAERARAEVAGAPERVSVLEAALKAATEKAAADRDKRDEAFRRLTARAKDRFAVAVLAPLTPEQIAWSMMQATGLVDRQRSVAEAEFSKKSPAGSEAERARFVEQFVYDKLKGNEAPFVKLFGGGPGQSHKDFAATFDQALFLAHGGLVRGWLAPSKVEGLAPAAGNLTDRLMKTDDPKELARDLYLSVFTRAPSDEEIDEVTQYLSARPTAKLAALQEMVWAMLASVEFRFRR